MNYLVKYKYIFTSTGFLIWIILFDKNNLIDQYQRSRDLNKLKQEADYYENEIKKANTERDALFTDKNSLERFAREKYYMKKDNEELYIMVDTTKQAVD